MNADLKYVLDNEIDRRQCIRCYAMWFVFDHQGTPSYYRLGNDEPAKCDICKPIDEDIEKNSICTSERWFNLDA